MTFRRAHALDTLVAEIDAMAPRRDKASDGWIGDAAHATRESDHNPWIILGGVGIVTAQDITHDPHNGCDAGKLAEHFRDLGRDLDGRVKYVIWDRRIASERESWAWRAYTGTNPHTKHVHLSVSVRPSDFDSTRPWGLEDDVNLDDTIRISATETRTVRHLLKYTFINGRQNEARIAALTEAVSAIGGGVLPADFDKRIQAAAARAIRNTLGSLDE